MVQKTHARPRPSEQGKWLLHWHNRFRAASSLGSSFQNRQLLEQLPVEVEEKAWLALPLGVR